MDGELSRDVILSSLIKADIAFIYNQDLKTLVSDSHAFEALICALTGYLKFRGQCEGKPEDFPRSGGWIEVPRQIVNWVD